MLQRYLPMLSWLKRYDRITFSSDLVAALIVTIMLIPQSLAYALLAGTIANWIRGNRKIARGQRLLSGSIFIGLGILTALSGRGKD